MVPALMMCAIQILLLPLIGGNAPIDPPLPVGGTDYLFQYDDGSAYWMSWDGLYRGVWFHAGDFWSVDDYLSIDCSEFWFYHHASYPWDTSFFLAEIWDGDIYAPRTLFNQTSIAAENYAPTLIDYEPMILFPSSHFDVWAIANTSMSSGGWPSILGDGTPNVVSHSFYSDDFITWVPWKLQEPTANDFFVRLTTGLYDLDQSTWGSIKTLFQHPSAVR